MRAHLNPLLFAMHAAPFGALGLERLRADGQRESAGYESDQIRAPTPNPSPNVGGGREGALAAAPVRIGLAILAFGAVTAPWLTALAVALGPAETPFGAFVGAIDTAGYYLPMDELREELKPMLGMVVLAPFLAWMLWKPWPAPLKVGVGTASLALGAGLVLELMRTAAEVHPRVLRSAILLTVKGAYNFILYLPLAAFWSAFGLLAARRVPSRVGFTLRWYLLAGSLVLLNQYPRMDEVHLMFSAPLIWIVGCYALWRLFAAATRHLGAGRSAKLGRAAMYVALLGLPFVTLWPTVEGRRADLLHRRPGGLLVLGTPGYVDVGLPGASMAEMDILVTRYHLVAQYFERESKPGDRIFVYPAAPLLYFLLDRPNATRFNHLFPGLLSPAEVREIIDRLASVPATHVIWDSFGSDYWVEAVQKGAYQQLTDYIWEAYEEVGDFGGLVILRRKAPQAGGAV
jgi:hypothetical protein